jgi:hypothetical protein
MAAWGRVTPWRSQISAILVALSTTDADAGW